MINALHLLWIVPLAGSFGYVTCGAAFMGLILADWRKYQLMEDASK